MDAEKKEMLLSLTKQNAVDLFKAGEVHLWRSIAKELSELAREGEPMPMGCIKFWFAVRFYPQMKAHVLQ